MAAWQMIAAIISNPFSRLSVRAALDILIIAMVIYYSEAPAWHRAPCKC